jgi:predicted ATPase
MITSIEALGYRCLRYVAKPVAPFQVLVGPNGSGKSAFLDVVHFLGDLLRVGPQKAITGDGTRVVAPRAPDPAHLSWMRSGTCFELVVEMQIPAALADRIPGTRYRWARYETAVQLGGGDDVVGMGVEALFLKPQPGRGAEGPGGPGRRAVFPMDIEPPDTIVVDPNKKKPQGWRVVVIKTGRSGRHYYNAETSDSRYYFNLGPSKCALANLPEDETKFPVATWVKRLLMEGVQKILLNPDAMRAPSPPGAPRRFQPDGSNLPWVVEALRERGDRFQKWVEHLRTALPDLRTVRTVEGPEARHRYLILEYQNGLQAPSWVVSDGTLRLLALTLIPYLSEPDRVYMIEEPENGIHPGAIETVYQSLSSAYEAQVLCASHAPIVLGLARPEDLLCFARTARGATDIVSGREHPQLREWKGTLNLGSFFAAGVLG